MPSESRKAMKKLTTQKQTQSCLVKIVDFSEKVRKKFGSLLFVCLLFFFGRMLAGNCKSMGCISEAWASLESTHGMLAPPRLPYLHCILCFETILRLIMIYIYETILRLIMIYIFINIAQFIRIFLHCFLFDHKHHGENPHGAMVAWPACEEVAFPHTRHGLFHLQGGGGQPELPEFQRFQTNHKISLFIYV